MSFYTGRFRRHRSGYGSAGERCMAVSVAILVGDVAAVLVGELPVCGESGTWTVRNGTNVGFRVQWTRQGG